ncbi:MAG: glutathione S-transferase [Pseudomonadota bacterium]|nr:glutathione S-transferase [Pseudomonadota bacterium]
MKLHRFAFSGHAHRVELFLSLLGKKDGCELVDVDLLKGEHKTPAFLKRNVFGEVPVLEDGEAVICDSNAILVWLALRYDPQKRWYPQDPQTIAEVQRWLAVASGRLVFGPNHVRIIKAFGMNQYNYPQADTVTKDTFTSMNNHLEGREWLVGSSATIADVSCYSHIAGSADGGIHLSIWQHLQAWLKRVEGLSGFLPYPRVG